MKVIAVIITLLWLPFVVFSWQPESDFYFWRHQLTLLTGALGFAYMSVAMLLAMRFPRVEEYVRGLDKGYAIHKQMGIGALVTLVLHWLIIESAKWLIALDMLARPERRARIGQMSESINWTQWAKVVGEYSFYAFVLFIAISLIQAISYRRFHFIHKVAGALFLAGVFHSVILLEYEWSAAAMNAVMLVCALFGSVFALISLSSKIGRRRTVNGKVISLIPVRDDTSNYRVLHLSIQLDSALDYHPGQFAYLNFKDGEPPHPFSVLAYDASEQIVQFAIKDLGDYTHQLFEQMSVNQTVRVEGGYGRFQIPAHEQQVWIGAGIGIVPFLAWLQALRITPSSSARHIELFYCRENENQRYFVQLLDKLVQGLPNVTLYVYTASQNQYLCAERVARQLDLSRSSVSFCGPVGFGHSLKNQLVNMGLDKHYFYSERFAMR